MNKTFFELIDQSFYFPQEGFNIVDGHLFFNNISLEYLIEKYGTPFKVTFLPKIGDQIKKAKNLFNKSIKANQYRGKYQFAYCTKCNHFSYVLQEVLRHKVNIETSSSYDIDIILKLHEDGLLPKETIMIHNGHKTRNYLANINRLRERGLFNSIIILDSKEEVDRITELIQGPVRVGIRIATDQEPGSPYYTSRLGIRMDEVLPFYESHLKGQSNLKLEMLHFFMDSGIKDSLYYWGNFNKIINLYAELQKACGSLSAINLGGGLPVRNSLGFEYDYKYMINEIVRNLGEQCDKAEIEHPDIFTEFGKYTIAESGATIFKVLEVKEQNDYEKWYIIDNSLMTTIPDSWGMLQKYILLPINKWNDPYTAVNIGGISCDGADYYNSEELNQSLYLPDISNPEKDPLYLGFFHTGAYQDSISGYGGIKHCLIPSPKHIVVDRDKNGQLVDRLFKDEQKAADMLHILGYSN